jgi:Domain of unknown function (DUF222)
MLAVSAGTAASRMADARSLCTRLPGTLAALGAGRITLAKARIINTATRSLSDDHTAAVEVKQTPGWSVTQHPDGRTTWTTPQRPQLPLPTTTTDRLRTADTHPASGPDEPPF